ncbi:MAG TPA: tetratricopeptide repeat protein [Gemmatimonadaceae bacterium]|nr:tetratricopeptide repeat protein [Gemmatimonadaceae bacterium]
MSSARQRAALSALDAVRLKANRLDPARNTEENAADIIDAWAGIETALRSLLGGSTLAGQGLIHEARQRQMIGFELGNQLAAALVVRDKVQRTDYTPSSSDIVTVRDAYRALQDALMSAPPSEAVPIAAGSTADTVAEAQTTAVVRPARRIPLIAVVGAFLLVVALIALWYFVWGPGSQAAFNRGVEYYRSGRPGLARTEFQRAAQQHRDDARPLIYLARISREEGDVATARQHLDAAIRLEPRNALAQREMGSLLFTTRNYPLARDFYIRAVQYNPADTVAQGWLGCTLIRLGRVTEGLRFIQRAGQGPWTQCAMAPQQMPMPPPR